MSGSRDLCLDLIGKPYKLGGNGDTIDCIGLVYEVLKRLEIPVPPFDHTWYNASRFRIVRDLRRWGRPVYDSIYDGDVGLLTADRPIFGVAWQDGVLHISEITMRVAWCPIAQGSIRSWFRCSHTSMN